MIELTILGAGPAYTSRPGAVGAAYLVRAGDDAILLDLGQGVVPNLAGASSRAPSDRSSISHLHPDHYIDLVPLRHYLRYDFDPPRRVAVLGPAGLADRLDALHDEPGFAAASLDIADLGGDGMRQLGGLTLEARCIRTPTRATRSGCRPARVRASSTRATAATPAGLRPLLRPGDMLLSEVSFGADPVAEAPSTSMPRRRPARRRHVGAVGCS